MNSEAEQSSTEPSRSRWVERNQALAAILLAAMSLFSPTPDLRPKPVLPATYEMVEPSDPPDLDVTALLKGATGPKEHKEAGQRAAATKGAAAATAAGALAADPHPFRSEEARTRYLALYDARAQRWPVPAETRMVNGAFGQTLVRISGPAGAPPLVLLHGISSNSLAWLPNVEALSRHYRVYAVDHIFDFGRSIYTRPLRDAADHLAWMDGLFDSLGLTRHVHLVGLSYGGWLAARYAQHAPSRLAKVVLLAPVSTVLPLSTQWIARAVLCVLPHPWFTRNFLRWLLPDLAAQGTGPGSPFDDIANEALTAMRAFKSRQLVPANVLSDAELQALTVPTLFLVSVHEKIYDPHKAVQRLGNVAPRIRTKLLPGAGHDLSVVQADVLNREILQFFSK